MYIRRIRQRNITVDSMQSQKQTSSKLPQSIKSITDTNLGLGITIVIICMIIYAILTYVYVYGAHTHDYNDFIFGYWVADDAFCQESDVDSMLLFIGKPSENGSGGIFSKKEIIRPAHMVIGEDIMNQKINIRYAPISSGFSRRIGKFSIKCTIDFEDECQIPSSVMMDFDIKKGSLRIHDDDNLYALMYKDHEISEQFTAKDKAAKEKPEGDANSD